MATNGIATASPSALGSQKGRRSVYENAGPERLAKQPTRAKLMSSVADPAWLILQNHLNARLTMLQAWRTSWMQHYSLLEAYILPRRGIYINTAMPTPNTMIRGGVINQNIVDPTGTQAMHICAAFMMNGLMSPSRPWFKLKPATFGREALGDDVVTWFEQVEEILYRIMARSNFYDAHAQSFEDLVTFGTAPMIIYEDVQQTIRCYNPCPGEYFISSSNANRVGTLYRLFVMTVSQIVEMFGLENCPADVQGLWRTKGGSLEVERLVAHAIEPNFPIEGDATRSAGVVPGDFTWREVYWIWGAAAPRPLSMRGFKDEPFICPRWAVTSNDAYGRSVGMDVLGDIMQLQVETKRKAEAIEKMVRPPMLGSMELKNEPSSILPGHVTYVNQLGPEKGMRPIYTVNPQIREMMEDLKEIQQRIRTGFYNDLILSFTGATKEMTAFEAAQRLTEKLQILGPVVERFQNEDASPAIKRVYAIAKRKNMLPPMPEALQGQAMGIEYVSMMALAQRASSTTGMERFAAMVGQLSGVYPEARYKLDPLEFLENYGEQLNVVRRAVRPNDEAEALTQQAIQQQQAAAAVEQLKTITEGAKNLGQTPTGDGQNAMSMILGNTGSA